MPTIDSNNGSAIRVLNLRMPNGHKNLSILNGRLFGRLEGNTNECVQCGITLWHTNTPQYCGREIILVELPARYYIHSSRLGFSIHRTDTHKPKPSIHRHTAMLIHIQLIHIKNESFNGFEATIHPPMNLHGLIQSNSDTHNTPTICLCVSATQETVCWFTKFPTFFIFFFV